jgi:hypothetical protein
VIGGTSVGGGGWLGGGDCGGGWVVVLGAEPPLEVGDPAVVVGAGAEPVDGGCAPGGVVVDDGQLRCPSASAT